MKTALYENRLKKTLNQQQLVRLIKYTISISLFFTQWSIRFSSRYSVTLFVFISQIFMHSSAIVCGSSDNNSTYSTLVSRLIAKNMLIQITFKTKVYRKYA